MATTPSPTPVSAASSRADYPQSRVLRSTSRPLNRRDAPTNQEQRSWKLLDRWEEFRTSRIVARASALILGGVLGFLVGRHERPSHAATPRLPRYAVNTLFTTTLTEDFQKAGSPLGVTSWSWGKDSSLVLALSPPSASHPMVLWQALSARDRAGLTALIGTAYTRYLLQMGYPVDVQRTGHPVVMIRYAWPEVLLALRAANGKIYVYPSPYDRQSRQPSLPTDQSSPGSVLPHP